MRILIIFFVACLLFNSCGIKDDPKYQSQNDCNKKIKII